MNHLLTAPIRAPITHADADALPDEFTGTCIAERFASSIDTTAAAACSISRIFASPGFTAGFSADFILTYFFTLQRPGTEFHPGLTPHRS